MADVPDYRELDVTKGVESKRRSSVDLTASAKRGKGGA